MSLLRPLHILWHFLCVEGNKMYCEYCIGASGQLQSKNRSIDENTFRKRRQQRIDEQNSLVLDSFRFVDLKEKWNGSSYVWVSWRDNKPPGHTATKTYVWHEPPIMSCKIACMPPLAVNQAAQFMDELSACNQFHDMLSLSRVRILCMSNLCYKNIGLQALFGTNEQSMCFHSETKKRQNMNRKFEFVLSLVPPHSGQLDRSDPDGKCSLWWWSKCSSTVTNEPGGAIRAPCMSVWLGDGPNLILQAVQLNVSSFRTHKFNLVHELQLYKEWSPRCTQLWKCPSFTNFRDG